MHVHFLHFKGVLFWKLFYILFQKCFSCFFLCAKVDRVDLHERFTVGVYFPHFYQSINSPCITLLSDCNFSYCFILFPTVPTFSLLSLLYLPLSPPSIHPSAHGRVIAANLSWGSLEGFRAGLCSSGLLNGESEWALRGRLDMSSLAATVYQWRQRRQKARVQQNTERWCNATYGE